MNPPDETPLRLTNPYHDCKCVERIQGNIDKKVFDYFFKDVLDGEHGARQKLLNSLIDIFYKAAVKEIPATYHPDNEQRIAELLNRISFSPGRPASSPVKPKRQPKLSASI